MHTYTKAKGQKTKVKVVYSVRNKGWVGANSVRCAIEKQDTHNATDKKGTHTQHARPGPVKFAESTSKRQRTYTHAHKLYSNRITLN